MINDVCKIMNIEASTFEEQRGESDSLAGLVLEIAGEIPQVNQVIPTDEFDFIVLEVAKNRIMKVKLTIKAGRDE
jgi:CBS domain containing-hemolysin-like protein